MSLSFRFALAATLGAMLPSATAAQVAPLPAKATVAFRVDSAVREFMAKDSTASISVAVVRGGDPLVRRVWGLGDVATNRPANEGMTYRIGSISKQFTAALLLKQVDRGKLSLSDSIGHYLSGLRPEWRPLTIEQLLNHTSGLQREFRQPDRRAEDLPADTLIAWAARDTMAFAPGTRHAYSNTGYMLLGMLVEKLYGKPYSSALRDQIARPLGLTTLGWCTDPEKAGTETTGYGRSAGRELIPAVYLHPSQSLGSGGICASAGDLAAWNRALHGGRVLSPASYAAMTTPRGAATAAGYGFGLRVGRTAWGSPIIFHTGGTNGFAAENAWYPAESLSVTVLYNTESPSSTGGPLLLALGRIALGLPPERPAAKQAPSATARAGDARFAGLAGEYQRASAQTVNFAAGADGRATAMIVRQGSTEHTLPRIR